MVASSYRDHCVQQTTQETHHPLTQTSHHHHPVVSSTKSSDATWKVMGSRRPLCAARFLQPVATLLQFMLVAWLIQSVNSTCAAVKPCWEAYAAAIDTLTPAPTVPYCKALLTYSKCVGRINPRQCRGDLSFHSVITGISQLRNNYNCTAILAQDALRTAVPPTARPPVAGHSPPSGVTENPTRVTPPRLVPGQCEYKGNQTYRHCGLFGDPHLRTFYDESMTCRAAGAWPMVFNEYLHVQVTNEPLIHGSGATATAKLSVIIKDYEGCAERKLYSAQAGNLPAYFVDGTQDAGFGHSVLIAEIVPGEHVEIHIKYISTVIVIRQQGQYLQFAIRMPQNLIHKKDTTQFCVAGCPHKERIDFKDFIKDFLTEKSQRQSSVAQCRDATLIDDYLDSCVFDLLTTGDQNFTKAAQHALMDVNRLHPKASVVLQNRTSVFEDEDLNYSNTNGQNGAVTSSRTSALLRLQLVLCLFVLLLVRQLTTCGT